MPVDSSENLLVELADEVRSRYWGKYRGLVDDVADPDDMGRIRAKVPSVFGDTPTPWATPCVPFAGKQHGLALLPEKNDGVWIEFEGGDPARPIWSGTWWAKGEMPSDFGPETRGLITSKDLKVIVDDKKNELKIEHGGGASIVLSATGVTVKFKTYSIEMTDAGVAINGMALKVT